MCEVHVLLRGAYGIGDHTWRLCGDAWGVGGYMG